MTTDMTSEQEVPPNRLVLSVAEAADALGISDDLVYELIERKVLPCLHFGRRRVITRHAIQLIIETAMHDFDPQLVLAHVSGNGSTRGTAFPPARSRPGTTMADPGRNQDG